VSFFFKNRWREQSLNPAHATQTVNQLNLGATPFSGRIKTILFEYQVILAQEP
jgi:hypothetical protein